MEILAVVKGLEYLQESSTVILKTDSEYVAKCITGEYNCQENRDLWKAYANAAANHEVTVAKILGHSRIFWNECADILAKSVMRGQPPIAPTKIH
jgi:ribonuclease HI